MTDDGSLFIRNVCAILSYHFIVFHQHHVVSAQSSDEDNTGDTFEAMDPLLPL